jgi:hypothetical protein
MGAVFFLVVMCVCPINCLVASGRNDGENCRALLQRSFDFDYLGTEFVGSNICQKLDFQPLIIKVLEREYSLRKDFQELLEEFEIKFLRGDLNGCMSPIMEMDRFLNECLKHKKSNWRIVLHFIHQYEYSVVRMMFHDACSSEESFRLIKVALDIVVSDELLKSYENNKQFSRVKIFKEMILIGIDIERRKKINGELPKVLSEISHKAKVSKMEYLVVDGKWQLFNPVLVNSHSFSPFNVYVPLIGYDSRVPHSVCLWLSSDFAKKRKELYQGNVINRGIKGWECFMKQGKLHMHK